MNEAELRREVARVLDEGDSERLITVIPSGSGIFHIANVGPDKWVSGYLSTSGRWTNDGEPNKYFGSDLITCAAELGFPSGTPPSGKMVEHWETTEEFKSFDVSHLPSHLRDELYKERGKAPDKWEKSHILLAEIQKRPKYKDCRAILAPSASGAACGMGGTCIVLDPLSGIVRRVDARRWEEWDNGLGSAES